MGLFYITLTKNIFASSCNIMYTFAVSQKFSWLPKITLITKTAAVHAVPLIVLQLCELSFDYSVAVSCTKL